MRAPLVSIIIPCHNAVRWVAATIESALGQSWPALELIVVDDGSTDGSPEIIRSFVPRGVRLVTQANAGAAHARNHGLRLATGEFIQFLDADDLLAPAKIERQVRLLQARGDDCVASGAWARFTHDPVHAVPDGSRTLWRDLTPLEWLTAAAEHNLMMATATWLLPRPLADRIGPWDTTHRTNPLDDMDYFDRARVAARQILFCPDALSYYRSALPGSLSRVRSDEAWRAMSATLHRSADLMLGLADTPATRHAVATMLQRFIYELYPACPDLAGAAAQRVARLGGSELTPEWGPARQRLAAVVGWRLTKRLHLLAQPRAR